jgi:small subunit ribosomal protein S19
VGQTDQGQEDALEQVDEQIHPSLAAFPQEGPLGQGTGEEMSRSVWKGPFFDGYLLKKADKVRESGRNEVIKIWTRRSTILPQFVGLTFGVYNGKKHIPVSVSEDMIGHKFGEFAPSRTYYGHAADKKAKRK